MEDQIKDKVVRAYGGVVLEEELKRRAKRKILEKAQRGGGRKFIYGIVAAAAVVIFVLGNILMIRLNLEHEGNAAMMETTSSAEEETTGNIQARALGDIQTLAELEELSFAANSYVWNLENNFFVAILCYDEDGEACLPKSNMTARIEYAYFLFDESGAKLKEWQENFDIDGEEYQSIGAVFMNGDWYEVRDSKKNGSEHYYEVYNVTSPEKSSYARHPEDEEIVYRISSSTYYFARLVTEGGTSYWQFGENIRRETDYSPEIYCKKHDWDEQCTSDMTVRDIYVTKNWIGESALKFKGLEHFFGEPVQTEFVTGDKSGMEGPENAYQVDYHFTCLNFHVSTEVNSDEIISVTLFGNHNLYVTEDIWIGMSVEEVMSKMDISSNAFFEHEGSMYSYFEKDGFLYEFVYMEEPVGENLPPYASYPKPDYVLNYAKISDAAKITESPVKSLGELMFGDYHSLEEGKSIYGE